jgi:hypothetical protein
LSVRVAIAAILIGAGVAIASAFASSLGLSVNEQRIAFGFGVLLVLAGIIFLIFERDEGSPTVGDDRSITTHGQSGGTNITGDVHISAPQSSVSIETVAENEPTDGGYQTTVAVHLEAPYAAKNLAVLVNRTSLKGFGLNRVDPAASLSTSGLSSPGFSGILVSPPLTSDYRVFIVTDEPDTELAVEARLNVEVNG